jgi:hypothetical protein
MPAFTSPASALCWPPPKRWSTVHRAGIPPKKWRALNVEVQDALHQLTEQRRISRQVISGKYLYTAVDRARQQAQPGARRSVEALPTLLDAARLEIPVAELKAANLLFYSLLDEQQRRLYAGLETLKLRAGRRSPVCLILRPRFPYCGPRTS